MAWTVVRQAFYVACALSSIVVSEGRLESEGIIGGKLAFKHEFKYQVSIQVYGQHICGGGIIGDNYVITAAHCFIDDKNAFSNIPYTVVAGSTNLNKGGEVVVPVDKIYVHKDYSTVTVRNDIAIVKLKTGLGLASNKHLSSLSIPKPSDSFDNVSAVISGYGYTWVKVEVNKETGEKSEVDGGSHHHLQYIEVQIISNAICEQRNGAYIAPTHLCGHAAQRFINFKTGVCSGDSGSPLVYENTIIGITSSSPTGCDESVAAAVYTRVSSYTSFIVNVLKNKWVDRIARVHTVPY